MGDYDGDGYLDVHVAEWRGYDNGQHSIPAQARLFHNQGVASPGHFADVTAAAGVGMDVTFGFGKGQALSFAPRFSDIDRDGHVDLAVVSDNGTSRLFWNNGDGTFLNRTGAAGIATGTNDMGFTLADFNGDGLLDWFATSIGYGNNQPPFGNRLFLNNGNRTFTDVTQAAGVREGGWGWGADVLDYNNDGLLDLVHTNGFSIAPTDQTRFFVNEGTRTSPLFVDRATALGVTDDDWGRGLVTLDYDRDGDLDLFIVNYDADPVLYRNDGGNVAGHWLQIKTVGTDSNRDGIGAYITVTPDLDLPDIAYVTEMDGSSNYLGQSELLAHFGLGSSESIDQIVVQWPSGYEQTFTDVAVNQRVTITEGLLADVNGDDTVDALDLDAWRQNFGLMTGGLPSQGDVDRNGSVDGADLLAIQRSLGRTVASGLAASSSAAAAVPEPLAWTLLAVAAPLLIRPRASGIR